MKWAHLVHPSSSPALRSQNTINAQAAENGVEERTDAKHRDRCKGGTAEVSYTLQRHGINNQEPNSTLRFSMEEEDESPSDADVRDTTRYRVESDNVEYSQGYNYAEEDQIGRLEFVKTIDRQMSPRREDEGGGTKRQKKQKGSMTTIGTAEEGNRQMDDHCRVTADVKVKLVLPKLEVKGTLEEEGASGSDQGSLRASSKSDDVHYRANRGRPRKSEVIGMERPLRHRLGRTAKNKEGATMKEFGEGARKSENGEVESGKEELVNAHKESCEDYDQEDKAAALAAVMEVHGTRRKGLEIVADFPGEAGVGIKKQCHSCKRFEIPKSTIICDKCQLSYHLSCVKVKPKQALDLQHEQWQCPSCGLETGYDYWPLGRVTPRHDCKSADPRRILYGADTTVATMVVADTVVDADGVMDGGGLELATNASIQESGKHRLADSKDKKAEFKDVKESHRYLVVSGSSKEPTVSANSGSEVRRGRGRPKMVLPRGLKDETRILDLEPGSSSGGLREGLQTVKARDLNTDVPAQSLHASTPVAVCAIMTYRPSLAENFGGPTISMSEDDAEKYKKDVQATLEDLRSFITLKNGNLDKRWDVVIKRRVGNPNACDKIFISPDKKHTFRSRLDVARYLGLMEGRGGAWKADATSAGTLEKAPARYPVQKTARGLKLPILCGDISIESLGAVDSWLTHDDKCRPWPVGYRSTWHDSETGSFCISEVVPGGKVGATFRVTRKSCLTLSASTKVAVTTINLDKSNTGFIDEKEEKDGSHPFISEVQLYRAETTPGKDNSAQVDTIGEFFVEGTSPSEAWKLLARQFVGRCRASSLRVSSLRSFCPHPLRRTGVVPFSARASDGSAPVVNPDLGADQGSFYTEFSGNNHEILGGKKLEEEVFAYQWLEEWLGNDRFGLFLPKVQLMFRDLSNASKVEASKAVVDLDGDDGEEAIKIDNCDPPGWSMRLREKKIRDNTAGVNFLGKEQSNTEAVRMEVPYTGRFSQIVEAVVPVEKAIPVVKKARVLPPSGEPLTRRLPGELVGDVLQVWEFLCRFSDFMGEKFNMTYGEFEAGLVDVGPASPVNEVLNPDGDCEDPVISTAVEVNALDNGPEQKAQPNEPRKADGSEVDCNMGSTGKEPNFIDVNTGYIVGEVSNPKEGALFTGSEFDVKPSRSEVGKQELEVGPIVEVRVQVEVQHRNTRNDKEGCICEPARRLPAAEREVAFPDGSLNQNYVTVADAHILVLKLLLADLQFRIVGTPNEKKTEEPKKKGRKPINEILQAPVVPEFPDDVPINVVTWPELVRRYLITLVEVEHSGDLTDLKQDDRRRLIRCLQGDGGVLCGALFTVVGVESDAQVLADAEKELASQMPKLEEKQQEEDVVKEDSDVSDESELEPEWVEALRPISKMATNVGARIRTKIRESLDLNPPEWAREILECSISKDVYRGNASGPTKKAVMEILKNFNRSSPANIRRRRLKRTVPSIDQIMQRCRFVLRALADADKTEAFSFLVGGPEGYGAQRAMVARPLDFRTIDARLAAGAYGGSVEAFAADVRQIWKNVEFVHKSSNEMMELAASLSNLFEDLLQKQVISLIDGSVKVKLREHKTAGAVVHGEEESVDGAQTRAATLEEPDGGKLQKAPWEDEVTCKVCGIDEDYESIILCDNCDAEYHLYCLNPPLEEVPEGKWFCPTCVAVERGFPEGPGGDGEMVEGRNDRETPEGIVDGEDDQFRADGTLEDAVGEDEVKSTVGESAAQSFLKILDAKEYWQLSITERVQLLKFLCEEALKTAQLRIHLEKSLDLASDLQQQLRTLVADRQQAAITAENQKMDRQAKLEERQTAVVAEIPKAPTFQAIAGKFGGGALVAQATKLKLRSADSPVNPNLSPTLPRLLKFGPVATEEVGACETNSRPTESVEEASDGGIDGQEIGNTVVEGSSVITLDASVPISISVIESKKRTQEKVDQSASEAVPLELLEETYTLERTPGRCNKRLRVGDIEPGKVDNAPVNDAGAGEFLKEGQVLLNLSHTGDVIETPQTIHVHSKIRTDSEEEKNLSSEDIDDQPEVAARDQSCEDRANEADNYPRAPDERDDVAGSARAETQPLSFSRMPSRMVVNLPVESRADGVHLIDCQVRAEGVDFSVSAGANNFSLKGKPTDPAAQSGREMSLPSCCKVVELASSSGTSIARIIQAEGTSLPPWTPKRKLELNTNNSDVVETQKKLKLGAAICNGVVKGKNSEESPIPHGLDIRSEGKGSLRSSKKKGSKQSIGAPESAQEIPALGEVIDVAPRDLAEAGVADIGSSIATAEPYSSGVKILGSQGSGADQILRTSSVSGGSNVLADRARTTLQDPISKLDTEIAKLELKLYNLTMRREHLGTDDLGREYWGLSGLDQKPLLVVSEGDHRGRAGFEGAWEPKCAYTEQSGREKPTGDGLPNGSGEKSCWWTYKTEESLIALVAWLNPRHRLEYALKASIYEWQISFSNPFQSSETTIQTKKAGFSTLNTEISNKEGQEARQNISLVLKLDKKSSQKLNVATQMFPSLRATSILQVRHGSSSGFDLKSSGKKSALQPEGRVTRCKCLEPLWRSRWHCQICHETYESSSELEIHQMRCPNGEGPKVAAFTPHPHSKKKKKGGSGKISKGKKFLNPVSEKGHKQIKSTTPKVEGTLSFDERYNSNPLVYEESPWMTEETSLQPVAHRHATRSKTHPTHVDQEMDPAMLNSEWATTEEPMDTFFLSDFEGDLQDPSPEDTGVEFGSFSAILQDDDWGANLRPEKFETKKKKQVSGKKSSKRSATQEANEEALANFDYASMPMSFSTPDSTRDRILQIGCIADQGPTFAPALHFAPAFDPSLMIQPFDSSRDEIQVVRTEELTMSTPPPLSPAMSPSEEVDTKDFDVGRLDAVSWYDPQSSGEVPPGSVFVQETGDSGPVVHPELGATWDYRWDDLVNLPLVNQENQVDVLEGAGAAYESGGNSVLHSEDVPPPSQFNFLPEVSPENIQAQVSAQGPELPFAHDDAQAAVPASANSKKPSRKFRAPEASLLPLEGEQYGILRGLQMRLLDMEAALGSNSLIPARSSPARRRAWRLLVKSAKCIYEMTKALVILEHMVRADCLKRTWCLWSSLSAAARSVTLSALALKLYALDAAVTYRRDKVEGEQLQQSAIKTGKKKKK